MKDLITLSRSSLSLRNHILLHLLHSPSCLSNVMWFRRIRVYRSESFTLACVTKTGFGRAVDLEGTYWV